MNYDSMSNSGIDNKTESGMIEVGSVKKLESVGFIVSLITIILAPLSFLPSPYVTLDLIKTFVIAIGTIISLIILTFIAIKEKKLVFLPRSLMRIGFLIIVSLIISSFLSISLSGSLFGQGFEISNASFIVVLFFACLSIFGFISRQRERAVVVYVGILISYIILLILHVLRIIFGQEFMTLGILNTATSTILGGWYSLGSFSMLVVIISFLAIFLLKLSSRIKMVYMIILALSVLGVLLVADIRVWQISVLVFLGLAICFSFDKLKLNKRLGNYSGIRLIIKSLAILPIIGLIVTSIVFWKGPAIIGPIVEKAGIVHSELVLPWQVTLNVTASAIQNYPLFGVGPNNFTQAFMVYKPIDINVTGAWSTEFSNGFGLLPSFVTTQGLVGLILWIMLFVFFGIIATKIIRNLPEENEGRFMIISSFVSAVFLWLVSIFTVPSHVILFFAFVFTGIFLGISYSYGLVKSCEFYPKKENKVYKIVLLVFVVLLVAWGIIYFKKTVALLYFSNGIKHLSLKGNIALADKSISKAIMFDNEDIYWRAKAEVALITVSNLISSVNSESSASTTQSVMNEINKVLNQALADARTAIGIDPLNYYNHLSEARVSEIAANVHMANGYENSLRAYNSAINLNPKNPLLYLSLANLQARNLKYDDALISLGKALQVKNNYLEAVFLLSQVYAAKGDMANAIVAAKVAVELNPQNSLLLFQLGILNYNNKDYKGSAEAFAEAIKLQPDYANARYFLGLSFARLNDNAKAIAQFEELIKTNPDNREISEIFTSLKNGKSIFIDQKSKVAPEKRSNLPVKEKK